jgi:hypothetical protein
MSAWVMGASSSNVAAADFLFMAFGLSRANHSVSAVAMTTTFCASVCM